MFTVLKSASCDTAGLTARCITKPDKPGLAIEVLTHNPLRRVLSQHVPHWNEHVIMHVSSKLALFACGSDMLIAQEEAHGWTLSPLQTNDTIRIVVGCDSGRRICIVTGEWILIVRTRNQSTVKSFRVPNIQQLFCRSIDSGPHERQLLLTYLTADRLIYAVNVDGTVSSSCISPSHGCLECASEPCERLVQNPKKAGAFIAFHESSYIFFSHTADMIWISKRQPLPCDNELANLFCKWDGELRKRSNSC